MIFSTFLKEERIQDWILVLQDPFNLRTPQPRAYMNGLMAHGLAAQQRVAKVRTIQHSNQPRAQNEVTFQ